MRQWRRGAVHGENLTGISRDVGRCSGRERNRAHASQSGASVDAQVVDDVVLRCCRSLCSILVGHAVQSRF